MKGWRSWLLLTKDDMEAMEEEEGTSECGPSSMPKEQVKCLSNSLNKMQHIMYT